MCGAVSVTAIPINESLSACHCNMCRAWTSSAFVAFACAPNAVKARGPVKELPTSEWASRAICQDCGSPLWYKLQTGPSAGQHHVAAGLFPDTSGMPLRLELYIDKKPHGYAFEDATTRRQMTEAEVSTIFSPPEAEE